MPSSWLGVWSGLGLVLLAGSALGTTGGESRLVLPQADAFDHAGTEVALDGDLALLGVPSASVDGSASGAVQVFERTEQGWTASGRLEARDPQPGAKFGQAVALDGTRAFVGAPYEDAHGDHDSGAVHVFDRNATGDWVHEQRLVPDGIEAGDQLGTSVAIGERWLVAGAIRDDVAGRNAGAVHAFDRSREEVQHHARLAPANVTRGAHVGTSVAVDGGTVLAGAPVADRPVENAGRAFVFARLEHGWTEQASLEPSTPQRGALFGATVALGGEHALVGAPREDANRSEDVGQAYLADRETWQITEALAPDQPAAGDRFGADVAWTHEEAIVAFESVPGPGEAMGFAFDLEGHGEPEPIRAPGLPPASTGLSIDASRSAILAGAPYADVGELDNAGLGVVFGSDGDGDGLAERAEGWQSTDPERADTDADGLEDGREVFELATHPVRTDTDGDALADARELGIGTHPRRADTDDDGLGDGREVHRVRTDPLDTDTDGDLVDDATEVRCGLDPRHGSDAPWPGPPWADPRPGSLSTMDPLTPRPAHVPCSMLPRVEELANRAG